MMLNVILTWWFWFDVTTKAWNKLLLLLLVLHTVANLLLLFAFLVCCWANAINLILWYQKFPNKIIIDNNKSLNLYFYIFCFCFDHINYRSQGYKEFRKTCQTLNQLSRNKFNFRALCKNKKIFMSKNALTFRSTFKIEVFLSNKVGNKFSWLSLENDHVRIFLFLLQVVSTELCASSIHRTLCK